MSGELAKSLSKRIAPSMSATVEGDRLEFSGLQGDTPNPGEADLRPIFDRLGLNPDEWELSGKLTIKSWDGYSPGGGTQPMYSYGGSFVPRNPNALSDEDRERLLRIVQPLTPPKIEHDERILARFVLGSDPQIGKRDEYGGTDELFERTERAVQELTKVFIREPAKTLVHLDNGDIVEGFENTKAQAHTNDLSFINQLRVSREWLAMFLNVENAYCEDHHVVATTSNHSAWRSGKDYLGRPGDDFGIFIHETVRDVFDAQGKGTTWHLPNEWREYTTANINGIGVALTHGHRAKNRNSIMDWWRGQMFAHPEDFEDTMLFVNGHWHSPVFEQVGRGKYRIQAGAMDGGSNWFSNVTGTESDPSVITFRVTEDFRIVDLQIIVV